MIPGLAGEQEITKEDAAESLVSLGASDVKLVFVRKRSTRTLRDSDGRTGQSSNRQQRRQAIQRRHSFHIRAFAAQGRVQWQYVRGQKGTFPIT